MLRIIVMNVMNVMNVMVFVVWCELHVVPACDA